MPSIFLSDGTKIRIDNVEVIEGGNLRLANVHPSDNGTYICSAVSPDGQTISASATLNVHSKFSFIYSPPPYFFYSLFLNMCVHR